MPVRGDLGLGVGGKSVDLDVVLLGVGAYPVEAALPEGGQGLAQAQRILDVLGDRARVGHGPGARVSGGVEGEGVGERPGGGVAAGERVSQAPLLAQRGDQGGVPVLLVEYLAFGEPWGTPGWPDPVARPVEPEPELTGPERRGPAPAPKAGGTWSKVPPGSSQPISRAVFHTLDPARYCIPL